jgi:hypothetical protein
MLRVRPCFSLLRFSHTTAPTPVLAGQQVVGRCTGPQTLVPRVRCEHVMDMGRTCERPHHPDKPGTFFTPLCACFATIRIPALALLCFVLRSVFCIMCL